MHVISFKKNIMGKLITHEEYVKANIRLEELINVVDDNTPLDDPLAKEFITSR